MRGATSSDSRPPALPSDEGRRADAIPEGMTDWSDDAFASMRQSVGRISRAGLSPKQVVKHALGAESAIIRSLSDLAGLQGWIDAGASGTFVADCRITTTVRAPWLSEWMNAKQAATAAVAG